MQAGAVRAQWTLQQNMSAEYVWIDPKKPEVMKLVPRASDYIQRVDPRQEDVCFATAVAHVVLRHVESLTEGMKEKLRGGRVCVACWSWSAYRPLLCCLCMEWSSMLCRLCTAGKPPCKQIVKCPYSWGMFYCSFISFAHFCHLFVLSVLPK